MFVPWVWGEHKFKRGKSQSVASSCKLKLARFSTLLRIQDNVAKAQNYIGGHQPEKM